MDIKKIESPYLSVIVPVYNVEKYLQKCIDSILNQTYSNLEVILVDDGSQDASGLICDEYKEKDGRIQVIHKKNEGPLQARWTGIQYAKGGYVTFVDADDWICENTYENVIGHSGGEDVLQFGLYRYYCEDKISAEEVVFSSGSYGREDIERDFIPRMMWDVNRNACAIDPSLCSKIVKYELIKKYLGKAAEAYGYHYAEDVAVVYSMLLEANSIYVDKQCYYYHRQREKKFDYPYVKDELFVDKTFKLYKYLKSEFSKSEFWELLQPQLEHFYLAAMELKKSCLTDVCEVRREEFPYWTVEKKSKVVLYGAGHLGKKYKLLNEEYSFCNIILWVDKSCESSSDDMNEPQPIQDILWKEFDYLLIAVNSPILATEIKKQLVEMGIDSQKIIWNAVKTMEITSA